MKKLLSLLSILTISGTAMPGVIAVAPNPNKIENNIETDNGVDVFYWIRENGERKPIIEKIYGISENYIRKFGSDNKNNKYYINNKNIYFVKNGSNKAIKINGLNFDILSAIAIKNDDNFIEIEWQDTNKNSHFSKIEISILENHHNKMWNK
ncbi:hypothetical protein [Spiroplasma endosymbiont of Ammophila pubescens]|uniref:hypothetical protein n=1 Tax=Spiroplasma endosymbiont of Ammophila pubescens TaxID=3066315 RepID=UPI0032B13BAE